MILGRFAHEIASTRRRRTTLLAVAAAISLILGLVATSPAGAGAASTRIVIVGGPDAVSNAVAGHLAKCTNHPVERVAGANRYATAAAVSMETFPGGASEVFVATGQGFPDAVAAVSPAALAAAPVLLTQKDSLPGATTAEINRLGATTIHILGGEGAVSANVESALAGLGTTDRLSGPDRYATVAAISQDQFPVADTVYVATGLNFPDALAAGPAAAQDSAPILLVERDSIPAATQAELDRLSPATTYVLGGEAVISSAVASNLPGNVIRLAGSNRYATAAAVSNATFATGVGTIYVTTGLDFPDALAGGAAAGLAGSPVLLVGRNEVPWATATEIARLTGLPCSAFLYYPTSATILAGAGDIADCGGGAAATAALLDQVFADGTDGFVFTAGDNAYGDGTPAEFAACYDPTWGRHKFRTYPSPGNHDYNTPDASGYFDYFGAAAGSIGQGYYSYEAGPWHVVSLNSNCSDIDGCGPGSSQHEWLLQDLAASTAACTAAYWHHPVFSSGSHGGDDRMLPLLQLLYDHGAEVVLVGHDHDYERFKPQTPTGAIDTATGIRHFVVGTGGRSLRSFDPPVANSEVRFKDAYGILVLTLYPTGYEWEFLAEPGVSFTDSGTGVCH